MVTGTVLDDGTSQVVCLPEEAAWDSSVREVTIEVLGQQKILTPKGMEWDAWFDSGTPATDDFMADREQSRDIGL